MDNANNVMRIDFVECCKNSDGKIVKGTEKEMSVLYNKTVITSKEVRELIRSGEYVYDSRVIVTTTKRADNLRSKKEN